MSAAHKITARGYQVIGRGYSAPMPGVAPAGNARESMANARLHSFARRVYRGADLMELGYGG